MRETMMKTLKMMMRKQQQQKFLPSSLSSLKRRRGNEIKCFSSTSSPNLNVFDTVKGFFGVKNNNKMELPPETFTLRELVQMFSKAEEEGTNVASDVSSGFNKIGLSSKQLEKICTKLTEKELTDPTSIGKRQTRLNEVARLCEDDEITADKVKRVILAHATTKLMFGKIRKAVLEKGASLPKSVADFENIVRDLQKSGDMKLEARNLKGASLPKSIADFENIVRDLQKSGDMKQEARNLKGAYSNNAQCPCNSGKRFKRCCGS